jgi:hypothetical protein
LCSQVLVHSRELASATAAYAAMVKDRREDLLLLELKLASLDAMARPKP